MNNFIRGTRCRDIDEMHSELCLKNKSFISRPAGVWKRQGKRDESMIRTWRKFEFARKSFEQFKDRLMWVIHRRIGEKVTLNKGTWYIIFSWWLRQFFYFLFCDHCAFPLNVKQWILYTVRMFKVFRCKSFT